MTTHAAVGRSFVADASTAGRDAAREALSGLPDRRADAVLVFATTGYDQRELLAAVRGETGGARLAGCSGEGVISPGSSDEGDFAVAVLAVRSDRMTFEPFLLDEFGRDPARRGADLADTIRSGERPLVGVLVFPDGLRGDCTELLEALDAGLAGDVAVVGGTAADAMTFTDTYQYADGAVASNAVSGMAIRGEGRIEIAVSHGCTPIGRPRQITRADSGWVREIDGEVAWSVFKEYLDGDPEDLNAEGIVHLCFGQSLGEDLAREYAPYVIRTPLGLDKDSGALFFPGGGMKTGQTIQLTRRDPDYIKESARACADRIAGQGRGAAPALVLQFDCAGRGRILFGACASREIVEPLQETLGNDTPWIGFHTYGEIAPIAGRPYYHNYTVALCALYDEA